MSVIWGHLRAVVLFSLISGSVVDSACDAAACFSPHFSMRFFLERFKFELGFEVDVKWTVRVGCSAKRPPDRPLIHSCCRRKAACTQAHNMGSQGAHFERYSCESCLSMHSARRRDSLTLICAMPVSRSA